MTRAATRAIRRHCRNFKTLTLDNGTEFHDYAKLEARFPVTVYFATPYHSWERGCNETPAAVAYGRVVRRRWSFAKRLGR